MVKRRGRHTIILHLFSHISFPAFASSHHHHRLLTTFSQVITAHSEIHTSQIFPFSFIYLDMYLTFFQIIIATSPTTYLNHCNERNLNAVHGNEVRLCWVIAMKRRGETRHLSKSHHHCQRKQTKQRWTKVRNSE